MKVSKEALRTSRQFIRLVLKDGTVNENTAREVVRKVAAEKPRHYIGILTAFQRMLRLELDKRQAVVESAGDLGQSGRDGVLHDLRAKHGADVTADFKVTPELLGGLRIKLGSTVWDGSVKARIDALRTAFSN